MLKNKKELLLCAEDAADYIIKSGSTGFVSFILDMIKTVQQGDKSEAEKLQDLYKILYDVKNSNLEVLSGGRSLKEAYRNFIDGFLSISKKSPSKYEMKNEEFKDLCLNDLQYVFGWVRRLVKAKETGVRNNREENGNTYSVRQLGRYTKGRGDTRQERGQERSSASGVQLGKRNGGPKDVRTKSADIRRGGDTKEGGATFNTQMQEQLKKLRGFKSE